MESLTTMRGVNMRVKTSRHQPAKSSKVSIKCFIAPQRARLTTKPSSNHYQGSSRNIRHDYVTDTICHSALCMVPLAAQGSRP